MNDEKVRVYVLILLFIFALILCKCKSILEAATQITSSILRIAKRIKVEYTSVNRIDE